MTDEQSNSQERPAVKIGVLAENEGENRVAFYPTTIKNLSRLKAELIVENGAGKNAFAPDSAYEEAGAKTADKDTVMQEANILLRINPPNAEEIANLPENSLWISLFQPKEDSAALEKLNEKKCTVLALNMIPRISRAQTMDVLSSQANIAGYKAAVLAASRLPKFFPMLTTAAGSIPPAKVLVVGAGVAGLQAIATSRRLGASVESFDVRSAVKEEVQSLGASFVEVEGAREDDAGGYAVEQSEEFLKKQQEVLQEHAAKADVIITTAQIPGKEAPKLINKSTVEKMKPGSVVVDLAASTGGNCELTENDQTIEHNGVTIIGDSNLPGTLAPDASKMFGRNITELLKLLIKDGQLTFNNEDEILKGCCLARGGEILVASPKQTT